MRESLQRWSTQQIALTFKMPVTMDILLRGRIGTFQSAETMGQKCEQTFRYSDLVRFPWKLHYESHLNENHQ